MTRLADHPRLMHLNGFDSNTSLAPLARLETLAELGVSGYVAAEDLAAGLESSSTTRLVR